jgi:hypothetical protein
MSTPQMTDDRLNEVLADMDRNRRLLEDSRRKRLVFESRLRSSGERIGKRGTPRGLLGWFKR